MRRREFITLIGDAEACPLRRGGRSPLRQFGRRVGVSPASSNARHVYRQVVYSCSDLP
jgi:hypothetical protein